MTGDAPTTNRGLNGKQITLIAIVVIVALTTVLVAIININGTHKVELVSPTVTVPATTVVALTVPNVNGEQLGPALVTLHNVVSITTSVVQAPGTYQQGVCPVVAYTVPAAGDHVVRNTPLKVYVSGDPNALAVPIGICPE